MGEVYCLYSSRDGLPKYVGQTEWEADRRWKKHVTNALDLVPGPLYDWMRDVARGGHYVGCHVLQSAIIPDELRFYERYWINQFPGLFNVYSNEAPVATPSEVARTVTVAIQAKLVVQD